MHIKLKLFIPIFLLIDLVLVFWILLAGHDITMLNPKGLIAHEERNLILLVIPIMFAVLIPVFIATFLIAWKYREGNTKATYTPDWDYSPKLQTLWWGILCTVTAVLCVINWHAAHALDPHVSISSTSKPLKIQVVALQWKWLFIYPEQGIATVNYVAFPEKTPITFELTGDAPMNSFWIPSLGSQMYAMAGMVTHLPLIADSVGEFRGSTAEISGRGFASMRFKAKSVSDSDFDAWVTSVKQSPLTLTFEGYKKLAEPSEDTPPTFYSSTQKGLYNTIIMKFMAPASDRPIREGTQNGTHIMPDGEEMSDMEMPEMHHGY